MFLAAAKYFRMWWPGTESNRRRQPFQGCALPDRLHGGRLDVAHGRLAIAELPLAFSEIFKCVALRNSLSAALQAEVP